MSSVEEEIWALQRELQEAQEVSNAHRLSERNVVDLVLKLQGAGRLDLVYTLDGKEFVTKLQVKREVLQEIGGRGGRARVDEVAQALSLDFQIVLDAVSVLVRCPEDCGSLGSLRLVSAVEVLSSQYIGLVCEEIAETLGASGVLGLGELATEYALPIDLVREFASSLKSKGFHFAQDTLYSQSYVNIQLAQVRGSLMAATRPMAIAPLVQSLGGKWDSARLDKAVKELAIPGRVKGGEFVPAVFEKLQRQAIDSHFQSDGFVTSATCRNYLVSKNAFAFVQSSFSDAVELPSSILSGTLFATFRSAVNEAIASRSFLDVCTILPAELSEKDRGELLKQVVSVLEADGKKGKKGGRPVVEWMGDQNRYVVSGAMLEMLEEEIAPVAVQIAEQAQKNQATDFTIVNTSTGAKSKPKDASAPKPSAVVKETRQFVLERFPALQDEAKVLLAQIGDALGKAFVTAYSAHYKSLMGLTATQLQNSFSSRSISAASAAPVAIHASVQKRLNLLEALFLDMFDDLQLFAKGFPRLLRAAHRSLDAGIDSKETLHAIHAGFHRNQVAPVVGLILEYRNLSQGGALAENASSLLNRQWPVDPNWLSPDWVRECTSRLRTEDKVGSYISEVAAIVADQIDLALDDEGDTKSKTCCTKMVSTLAKAAKHCALPVKKLDSKAEKAALHSYRLRLLGISRSGGLPGKQFFLVASALVVQQTSQGSLIIPIHDVKQAATNFFAADPNAVSFAQAVRKLVEDGLPPQRAQAIKDLYDAVLAEKETNDLEPLVKQVQQFAETRTPQLL